MPRSTNSFDSEYRAVPLSLASILLVEADRELRDSRRLLLSSLHHPILALSSYHEVQKLPPGSNCRLAIIGLPPHELEAERIARHVRHLWPGAKILLLGQPSEHFSDPLYDEYVLPSCNPAGVVGAARGLLKSNDV